MKLVQLIAEHSTLFLALFVIGCAVSLFREFRPNLPPKQSRRLRLLEWCLLPPGFALIFITLQQQSVPYFAQHPTWTIAAFLGAAALATLLILAKRRKLHPVLTWLGGLFGVTGVVFSLILLGLYFQSSRQFEQIRATYAKLAATAGRPAPDFAFTLVSNREKRQLADFRGKVVVLNIWATWCVPCLKEMPDLDTLQKKFGREGLVVINLSDESVELLGGFLAKRPMSTIHGRVERREVPEFYQFGGARPTTFLIGPKGEVIESIVGARDLEYFERIVKPLL